MRSLAALLIIAAAPALAAPPKTPAARAKARVEPFAEILSGEPINLDFERLGLKAADVGATDRRFIDVLAKALPYQRQKVRWAYARHLMATRRPQEALGVLDVMSQDEPGLLDMPAFLATRAVGNILTRNPQRGIDALTTQALVGNPHACLWRMRAREALGQPAAVLADWSCARENLRVYAPSDARSAKLVAARAYVAIGRPQAAWSLAETLPSGDPLVRLLRGKALLAAGKPDAAATEFNHALELAGPKTSPIRLRAMLGAIDTRRAAGKSTPAQTAKDLEAIRYAWRGGTIEHDTLWRLVAAYKEAGDDQRLLAASAILYRYFELGPQTARVLAIVREGLRRCLDPQSPSPLSARAGVFWDYRDLVPQGPEGDNMVRSLADQLAAYGLYARAADLLTYQVHNRMTPGSGASVALQAAVWRMMNNDPAKASAIISATAESIVDTQTATDRRAVQAFALLALGKGDEAYTVIEGDGSPLPVAIRAELYWQARDWKRFLEANRALLSRGATLDNPARTVVIRQLIAAAIEGDTAEIGRLRTDYSRAMSEGSLSSAFELLVADGGLDDGPALDKALDDLSQAVPPPGVPGWIDSYLAARLAAAPIPKAK